MTVLSSCRVVGEEAFSVCEQLAEATLREGLEEIRERAFLECISLRTIAIRSTVRAIDGMAF